MNVPFKFALGTHVREVVTGFEGYVCGRAEHLTGCNTYGIQPAAREEDRRAVPKFEWFDEQRLQATGQPGVTLPTAAAPGAGPNPTRR